MKKIETIISEFQASCNDFHNEISKNCIWNINDGINVPETVDTSGAEWRIFVDNINAFFDEINKEVYKEKFLLIIQKPEITSSVIDNIKVFLNSVQNDLKSNYTNISSVVTTNEQVTIFISHNSKNAFYGKALVKLLRNIGLERKQIIFTSDSSYGIPIGEDIFQYLRAQIQKKPIMIFLLSEEYYKSIASLNEMGAAWMVQSEYWVIGVPGFDFNNENFTNGAINPRQIGFAMNDKKRVIEFKQKLCSKFNLTLDAQDWEDHLEDYLTLLKSK